MVIPAGGELTADFRLRFGNPARDAERQAASHHREHQNPHERIMQTVLERGLDHLVFAGSLLSGRILKQLVNAVDIEMFKSDGRRFEVRLQAGIE